jgi:DNA ligase-1
VRVSARALAPHVWLEPHDVWEVRAADLSLSPVHTAALGRVDPARGIALRFPRLLRVRDDKEPEAATSAAQVEDMYRAQPQVRARSAAARLALDDDDADDAGFGDD